MTEAEAVAERRWRIVWPTFPASARLATRMIVAAMLSFLLGEVLSLTQPLWAVISSILIVQGTAGGTLRAAIDRLVGTIIGSVAGALGVAVQAQTGWPDGTMLLLVLLPTAGAAGWQPRYRVAPVTAAIILLAIHGISPLDTAVERIVEIALGNLVGIATSFAIIPGRARRVLHAQAASVLVRLSELARRHLSSAPEPVDPLDLSSLARAILQSFVTMETTIGEAALERLTAGGMPPDALLRTLRRAYNDLVFMGRVLGQQTSEPVRDAAALTPLRLAVCGWFEEASRLIVDDEPLPELDRVVQAIEALVPDPTHPDLLGFTLVSLKTHLADLRDRLNEFEQR